MTQKSETHSFEVVVSEHHWPIENEMMEQPLEITFCACKGRRIMHLSGECGESGEEKPDRRVMESRLAKEGEGGGFAAEERVSFFF